MNGTRGIALERSDPATRNDATPAITVAIDGVDRIARPSAQELLRPAEHEQQLARMAHVIETSDAPRLGRVILAMVVAHEPDDRGRCAACRPTRWRWWSLRRRQPWCPVRAQLAGMLLEAS